MNPWLPHPGVPVDQADPASCTAASVSSLLSAPEPLPPADAARTQEEVTGLWLQDIDRRVAVWRKMVLEDERVPMADRVEMVLRDEQTMRDSIAKAEIAKIMKAIGTPDMKASPLTFATVSDTKLSEDGTFTCSISVPVPVEYICFDLKLDSDVALVAGDTLETQIEVTLSE